MNIAVILAGGTGSRMGLGIPKQFIEVMGKPIIAYTLEKYQTNRNINAIEIVCLNDYISHVKAIVEKYSISKVQWYADGGETFQESTVSGVFNLRNKIKANDIVLIQFAVSPMITDEIIDDAIRVCRIHGNAIPADEMIMCTCIKDNEYSSSRSILRETLVGLNAPWTFRFGDICQAYDTAIERGILHDLEPHTTSLYFALGKTLYFSKSSSQNIKITHKEDLDLFEGYLLLQQKRTAEGQKNHR